MNDMHEWIHEMIECMTWLALMHELLIECMNCMHALMNDMDEWVLDWMAGCVTDWMHEWMNDEWN